MDEEKVVVEETVQTVNEPVIEDVKVEAPQNTKASLMAFIFSLVAISCSCVPFASIAGIVFSAIAGGFLKKAKDVTKKPFSVFNKVSKPVKIVALILSIIMTIVYTILFIVGVIAAIAAELEQ